MSNVRFASCAEALMTGALQNCRKTKRELVHLSAGIQVESEGSRWHAAFVKDVSSEGMFFYSDFRPSSGDPIKFKLKFTDGMQGMPIWYKGTVVRVENAQAGAAIGVAVELEGYDFISQTEPERLASSAEKKADV
jgi:hypothetical protein